MPGKIINPFPRPEREPNADVNSLARHFYQLALRNVVDMRPFDQLAPHLQAALVRLAEEHIRLVNAAIRQQPPAEQP